MFLLFLIGLGTADVNAQVRIGGNAAPNGAAVLDLNATDAATGTKGLALPRVRLDSTKMQITPGVANLNGMLVYNTTATLGTGIYFWNGAAWTKANLPATSASDSGRFLMSNGNTWVTTSLYAAKGIVDSFHVATTFTPVTWNLVIDTIWLSNIDLSVGNTAQLNVKGMRVTDICFTQTGRDLLLTAITDNIRVSCTGFLVAGNPIRFRCYRPSV